MTVKRTPDAQIIREIAKVIPTPFHLYDEEGIRQNIRALQAAFSWDPNYREYFAVKATPTPGILRIFQEEGCGVDCASLCELMLAKAMGFTGDQIMFSSNDTPDHEYAYARSLNAIINLDDRTMVESLQQNGGIPEDVCLRLNPGGEFMLGNFVMGTPRESKFGMTEEQLMESVKALIPLGMKRFALHAFLASNATDESYYPTMARILFTVAKDIVTQTGIPCFMINLSGGIGIPYRPEQDAANIRRIGEGVRAVYEEVLGGTSIRPRIASELGRFMTGPYGWLVTHAIHEKHTHKDYIGVDACAADLMRPAMYDAYHHITVLGKENEPVNQIYDVTGALCENNDKFAVNRPLPKIDRGDIVVIHDTGAHGRSMGYNYNGKLRSAEVLLKSDGSFELIRRAETPADYFATLDFTGIMDAVQ